MATNSKNFRIGKSIEEIMLQRSIDADILPPVHTSQQLQRTLKRVNQTRKQTKQSSTLRTSRSSASPLDGLRHSGSAGKIHPPTSGSGGASPTYDNFIMESLMEHCRSLQARVQDLETKLDASENEKEGFLCDLENLRQKLDEKDELLTELAEGATPNFYSTSRAIPTPLISAARQSYNKPDSRSGGGGMNGTQRAGTGGLGEPSTSVIVNTEENVSRPMSRQENEEAVVHTVNDMDSKIRELRLIFHANDPMEERIKAAVKIGAFIRGWLVRQRYQKYWKALYEFRYGRVKKFLSLIETDLSTAGNVESGARTLMMKRNTSTMEKIFERWAHICRQTAPFRRANLLAAENKYLAKRLELLERTFSAFKGGTIGGDSHKQLRQERRTMIERIRVDLKEQYEKSEHKRHLVVTEMDLQRAVYREVVTSSIRKRNTHHKRKIFDHFKVILDKSHHANKTALRHQFHRFAGKCFYAWSDWTYSVGSGLERQRWPGPRKYEVRYNQKLVNHFIKMRLKKMAFKPWKRFSRTQATVNLMFAQKLTTFIRETFTAWKVLTKHHHVLRKEALTMWMGYARDLVLGPFIAWRDLSASTALRRNQQNRLVNAYVRWKQRQKHIRILQTWRHQALYGGVEGMYSRTTISKSLGEQKSMCASLQKMISRQTVDLEECRELVNREVKLRKKLEDGVVDKDSEIERLKMKGHHMDQELRRLHAVIESMAKINPAQVALIKEMQPEFNFQERKVFPTEDPVTTKGAGDTDLGNDDDDGNSFTDKSMTDILGLNDAPAVTVEKTSKHLSSGGGNGGGDGGSEERSSLTTKGNHRASLTTTSVASEVSQEDKRLLLRIKWMLANIFPDVKAYNRMNDDVMVPAAPPPARRVEKSESGNSDADKEMDLEKDEEAKEEEEDDGKNSHMSKDEKQLDKQVQEILKDPADAAEMSFIFGMLAFLKDGTTKSFSKKDSRAWAKVLLKSVGRDTDILDTLLPDEEDKVNASSSRRKLASLQSNETPEMDDWRSVLIHLQTFYPVGSVGRIVDVEYEDDKNMASLGVLTRVRNMRAGLKEVVKYKVEKISRSKTGKSIASNLIVSGIGEENEDIEALYNTHDDNQPGINMYAGNLINHIGGVLSPRPNENGHEETDLSEDDDSALSEYDPTRKSQILSMHNEIMKHVTEETSSYSDKFIMPSGSGKGGGGHIA